MKKSLLFALAGLFLFTSCTKDEEDDDNTTPFPQELVLDGTRYEWGTAFMEHFSDYGVNSENLDLFLITDGINVIYDANNYPDSITGSGYILYFEMFSSDSTYMSNGTYTNDSTLTLNTYYGSSLGQVTNGEFINDNDIENGEVVVSRDGSTYTITGSGKDATNNVDFTFSYQGAITVY